MSRQKAATQIHFRDVSDGPYNPPVDPDDPPGLPPLQRWYVEAHQRLYGYPLGLAVVRIFPVGAPLAGAHLSYLFVADGHRGEGIAREIAAACRERWPGIQATPNNRDEWRLLHALGFDPGRTLDDQIRDARGGD